MTTEQVLLELKKKRGSDSLTAFAERVGCSLPYLSDVYNGRRTPGPRILRFLGLKVKRTVTRVYSRE